MLVDDEQPVGELSSNGAGESATPTPTNCCPSTPRTPWNVTWSTSRTGGTKAAPGWPVWPAVSFMVAAGAVLLAANYGRLIDWTRLRHDVSANVVMWAAVLLGYVILRLASRRVDVTTPFRFRIKLRRVLGGAASAVSLPSIISLILVFSPQSTLQLSRVAAIGLVALTLLIAALSVFGRHSLGHRQ